MSTFGRQGRIISKYTPGERLHVGVAFDDENATAIVKEMNQQRPDLVSWAEGGLFDKVTAERRKQIERGHDAEHDDGHDRSELAMAALSYVLPFHMRGSGDEHMVYGNDAKPEEWPFDRRSWRPSPLDRKHELVKAMALLAAEYERLERTAT